MSSSAFYNAVNNYSQLNFWIRTLNNQVRDTTQAGHKSERITFLGGITKSVSHKPGLETRTAELTLQSRFYTDFSQGSIVSSHRPDHLAISGQGFFTVTDGTNLYYTRDGEFHQATSGHFVNRNGLMLVDAALAAEMGLIDETDLPPLTAGDIDGLKTGWRPAGPANNGATDIWLPYVPGTSFEGGGTYDNINVYAKKTFVIPEGSVMVGHTVQLTADNRATLMVNGQIVTDVVAGPDPATWPATTTYDISRYLTEGTNTIAIKAHNENGPQGIRLLGTVAGQNISTNASTWSTSIAIQQEEDPADYTLPTAAEMAYIFGVQPSQVLLTNGEIAVDLQRSMWDSSLFMHQPKSTTVSWALPNVDGRGLVVASALESSNTDLPTVAPELSLTQKMFEHLGKVLTARISNLDLLMGLIR